MKQKRLLIGVLLLSVLYFTVGPKETNNFYLLCVPLEAVLFSLVVLYSYEEQSIRLWVLLPSVAAILNFLIVYFWAFILTPALLLEKLGIVGTLNQIISWAIILHWARYYIAQP